MPLPDKALERLREVGSELAKQEVAQQEEEPPRLIRYLVMVDTPAGYESGPPIAGIYVYAENKVKAVAQVRQLLRSARLTIYRAQNQ